MAHISNLDEVTRRAFLERSGKMAALGTAAPFAMTLASINDAAAFTAGDDYRALVCVFLLGGNDHNSLLYPYDDTNYNLYSAIRGGGAGQTAGGITPAKSALAATALNPVGGQVLTNNIQYALHPSMTRLKSRFDASKAGFLLNVGPLIIPLTRDQYNSQDLARFPRPARLMSHNDQQSTWQAFNTEGTTVGWGGRLADLAMSSNFNAAFTGISAAGNTVFLAGRQSLAYQVSTAGAVRVTGVSSPLFGSSVAQDVMRSFMTRSSTQLFEGEYNKVSLRSIQSEGVVTNALAGVNLTTSFVPPTGTGAGLASQLQVVARLIAARSAMGVKRQVFYVGVGGYDVHDTLNTRQAALYNELDFALDAFYNATTEIGVADKVTTFTASDFGRTLQANGDGSDHGWGAHHIVMGGAVNGGRFFGSAPPISITTPDQVGNGRLIPSTSVDQYAATLGAWFGANSSELSSILPNLGNFNTPNLGFLA